MMTRAGSGWQYILADLSLILFMVTAAALASADEPVKPVKAAVAATQAQSPQGEPLALYRAAPGAPPLGQWLREQSADARQQLTIVARYRPGQQDTALTEASAMAHEAGVAGVGARIIVEPGEGGTTAALAFDAPAAAKAQSPPAVAQSLQDVVPANSLQEERP